MCERKIAMKTRKYIVVAVVAVAIFAVASNSFARPAKHRSRSIVAIHHSYRSRHKDTSPHRRKFRAKPYRRGKRIVVAHRRNRIMVAHRRNRIVVRSYWLRAVFAPPRQTIVVTTPPKIIETAGITVWITNDNGSKTAVTLTRDGPCYVGPLGEYYTSMPTEAQLKMLYGLGRKN